MIPVWNEEAVLPVLYERLVAIMASTGEPWEVIFVNDGSRDRTLPLLLELHAKDQRIKVLNFSRNFGHQVAISAGFDFAEGDAVIVMDADLQDPPEVVLRLIEQWRAGFDVVYAVRIKRTGESRFKLFTASLFYRLIHSIADIDIPLDAGDFRLMDRRVVLAMRQLREKNRFMRGLSSWVGFKQVAVEYERAARFAGETKYPFRKMVRLALNAITSFSHVPLQLATYTGFALAGREPAGHLGYGHRPLDWAGGFYRPGDDPGERALPGRHPTDFPGHHRRISGPHLRRGQESSALHPGRRRWVRRRAGSASRRTRSTLCIVQPLSIH